MERKSKIKRTTNETDISIELELPSIKKSEIDSGVSFLDHMLVSMSKHGRFYINLNCSGDTQVDNHHSVEDIGICIGMAFKEALGNKAGIRRFGNAVVPMDEALTMVAVDLSGRSFFRFEGKSLKGYIDKYSAELTIEFLRSFAHNAEITLHVNQLYGDNKHHIHESIFKALGQAIFMAISEDESLSGKVLSTKGTI